ncbi:hypothetical protein LTR16_002664 [Cryomyces antarcticus]|uniref:Uncharacterized protein n=2 Tax=Cryomyces antarcticus TaxID=329879 RepID=A0ABR0LYG0_9PEZI|nr:hypothetical protein LTR60_001130 [Cryomyces antarcticus]KAK5256681.1 hypothetical protein LTR16_002664 [Cryomyces antarcticus]
MPPFLRRCCQAMLTAQWTHRLPFLQSITPAERAAALILRTLDQIEDLEESKFTIIDFCSGGGGPVPTIERLVNQERASQGQKPIPFLLSDIHPHLDAWITASSRSEHLSFVPQSVDATHPPVSVTSRTSTANSPAAAYTSDTRVFRLYCLAFHHFPDALARKTLASTLATSDGFAIIELQDRHVFSLALMVLDLLLVFFVSPLWFWGDWLRLLFTNIVPLLPVIQAFDGAVSCLRTRTFEEVMALVDAGEAEAQRTDVVSYGRKGAMKYAERGEWVFQGGREMHTWPIGYMTWVAGWKRETGDT